MSTDNKQTNILLLFWGRRGGGARYSLEIAKELAKREDVNLFLSVSNQCDLISEFKRVHPKGLFLDTYNSISGFIKKWVFERYKFKNELTSYLKENRIDLIIIGMDFFWGDIIYKSANVADAKTMYVVHEPKPHPGEPFFMSLVKNFTLKTLIKGADHLVTLTDSVKEFLKRNYRIPSSKVSVIPHGIFAYHVAKKPKELPANSVDPVVFLYFGTITYYKGLDILLKAFAILEKKVHFPVKLEIWGSGDMSEYQKLVDELSNVRIENRWIDESEVGKLFERAHVCVLPYRELSQSGILGAASKAALPVVACPAGGLKNQMGGDLIVYANDFSSDSLANELYKLILDPKLYNEISENLMYHSKKLAWSSIAEEFVRVNRELVNTD